MFFKQPTFQTVQTAVLLVFFAMAGLSVRVEAKPILPAPQKLSKHVYAWIGPLEGPNEKNRGYRMNMLVVVGEKSIAVVDTGYTQEMADEMVKHIRQISDKPIKYAINSNSQPHRCFGNAVFQKQGAELITSSAEATRMKDLGDVFASAVDGALKLKSNTTPSPVIPKRLITNTTNLDLGNVTLKLDVYERGHTPAPIVVQVVEDNLVYAGDMLYAGRLLAVLEDSSVNTWISGFDKLRGLGKVRFIPGHGQPGPLSDFEFSTYQYLKLLQSHMNKALDNQTDMIDAINSLDQGAYSKLTNFEELARRNASFAYREAERDYFKQ